MLQRIFPQHCDDAGLLDMGELLRWADLATCASAEAHTGQNCVTVAASDLALEPGVVPAAGDMVELRALPVVVGNTSLEVSLLVHVECPRKGTRVAVCSASFTYVTMRLADGSRPKCPPLVYASDDEKYAAMLALERKAILKKQPQKASMDVVTHDPPKLGAGVPMRQTLVHMTELVLPAHTNHMNNTFGGQVMAWMHKAAAVCACRYATRGGKQARLRTRVVAAVDFPAPSTTSDHLLVEAKILRVFPPNHMLVSVLVQKRVISENSRVQTINNGVFHMDAVCALSSGEQPLALDLVVPDEADATAVDAFVASDYQWQLLNARAALFGFRGGAVPWVSGLWQESARTNIEAFVRLLPMDGAVRWKPLDSERAGRVRVHLAQNLWGQPQAAARFDFELPGVSARLAFQVLMDCGRRTEWDRLCVAYSVAEQLGEGSDLVRMTVRVPRELTTANVTCLGIIRLLALLKRAPQQSFTMQRAWREGEAGEHVIASRTVAHSKYPASSDGLVALPSGWSIKSTGQKGCSITYIAQMHNENVLALLGSMDKVSRFTSLYCSSLQGLCGVLERGGAAAATE